MKSRTTKSFWRYFDALPSETRRHAVRVYGLWRENQSHPSLHFKCVSNTHAAYSVRIGIHYRALGYRDELDGEARMTWFWIGSHADYDKLLNSL